MFSSDLQWPLMRPPSGVRASGNWLFFVREFVKMKKIVREFVKTISFVIRENKKYGSWIRENWNICSWIRELQNICDSWFVNWQNHVRDIVKPSIFSSFVSSWKWKKSFVNSWIEPPLGGPHTIISQLGSSAFISVRDTLLTRIDVGFWERV